MRAWLRELCLLLGFLAAAILLTWPLAAHFTTDLGGDYGDHWQTLWGMWWVKKALLDLHVSPFFSTYVHWPIGTPLYFETFDLPDCLLAIPLWSFLSPLAVFNCVELWSYPLAGYFFYRFALSLLRSERVGAEAPRGQRRAAVLAGALFTFAPYHFGHALGHLHILALEWVPLYFWMLVRSFDVPRLRYPLAGGLALAAASTASWYYLLFCVVLTAPYLGYRLAIDGRARSREGLRQALVLGASYLALMGPLFYEMLAARAREPWDGAHSADVFSADLYEFFVPNAAQLLGRFWVNLSGRWSGNPAENCDYLGYAVLALALVGALRTRGGRLWLGVAALGAVLALGPHLHQNGQVFGGTLLPYGLLERAVPLLAFTGCPVRAGFIATFALSTAAAFALATLSRSRRGARVSLALCAVACVEFYPHAFTLSHFPQPALFKSWAADPSEFAVDDLSGDTRPLYNGVLHGHPLVDVYLSRTPLRLIAWLDDHPILGRLRHPTSAPLGLSRAEGRRLLREEKIRYFILPQWRRDATLERDLELPVIYTGEGLRVFEVPATD